MLLPNTENIIDLQISTLIGADIEGAAHYTVNTLVSDLIKSSSLTN